MTDSKPAKAPKAAAPKAAAAKAAAHAADPARSPGCSRSAAVRATAAVRPAAAVRRRRVPARHGAPDEHARDRRARSWASLVPLGGIITGHIALGQIKRTGEGGHGLALAGTIIGYVLTGLGLLVAIFYIIFFVALASSGVLNPGTVI